MITWFALWLPLTDNARNRPLPPRRSPSPTIGLLCTSVQHLPRDHFLDRAVPVSQWLIYWLLYSLISLAEAVLWPALK